MFTMLLLPLVFGVLDPEPDTPPMFLQAKTIQNGNMVEQGFVLTFANATGDWRGTDPRNGYSVIMRKVTVNYHTWANGKPWWYYEVEFSGRPGDSWTADCGFSYTRTLTGEKFFWCRAGKLLIWEK